ncbi:hypothetical protein PWT90_02351 [Aphanocladium album]|nr:hypothetical protein PWT90_02351 [Aphanocladium album]
MAVAVAHAFMRSIRGRSSPPPATSPSPRASSPSGPRTLLPGGLVYESHADTDVMAQQQQQDQQEQRRRSSAITITSSSTNSAEQQPTSAVVLDDNLLSVAAAVVGLVASSHRTFHDVQDINVAPRTRTASLQKLQAALKSFKLTVQLLYKWLRRFERAALPHPDRPALVEVDALIVMVAEVTDAVSEAGNVLVDVVRSAARDAARISDVVPEYAAAIVSVSERIERVEHLISKLLTIFQISSLPEATAARATIDAALPVIMAENASLAESIRSMPDVFSARALVDPSRLAAVLARPPPGYSVPAPTVSREALPDYSAATASNTHPDGSVTIRPLGWSVFASLTMADLGILSLVPLPFCAAELRYGEYYTEAFFRRVDPQLAELMEVSSKSKAARLAGILGSRSEAAVAMTDNANFARRVGLELENERTRDGRPRPRVQPNVIIAGP